MIHVRTPSPSSSCLPPAPALPRQAGFTLIEVLVSALLVILIATATAKALITTSHTSGDQRLRSQADALATQDQERLRGLSDEQLANLTRSAEPAATVNGTTLHRHVDRDLSGHDGQLPAAPRPPPPTTGSSPRSPGPRPTTRTRASISEESMLSRPVAGDLLTGHRPDGRGALGRDGRGRAGDRATA